MVTAVERQLGVHKPKQKRKAVLGLEKMNSIVEEEDSETETSQKDVQNRESASPMKRSVSLPFIRHNHDIFDEDKNSKHKLKERSRRDIKPEQQPVNQQLNPQQTRILSEHWDEIFFHYFEDRLRLFLQDKQGRTVKRNRFKSEFIE